MNFSIPALVLALTVAASASARPSLLEPADLPVLRTSFRLMDTLPTGESLSLGVGVLTMGSVAILNNLGGFNGLVLGALGGAAVIVLGGIVGVVAAMAFLIDIVKKLQAIGEPVVPQAPKLAAFVEQHEELDRSQRPLAMPPLLKLSSTFEVIGF